MKKGIVFIFALLMFVQCFSQDSINKKLKFNEVGLYFSKPFYVDEQGGASLIRASLKDESLIDVPLSSGYYADTMRGHFYGRGYHYFPSLSNINVGARSIIYLNGINAGKFRFYMPVNAFYESIYYTGSVVGKTTAKRLDTIYSNDKVYYADSSDLRKVDFRNFSNRIFLQSGICIESGKKAFKFSAGLTAGIGIGFSKIRMYERHLVLKSTSPYYSDYKQEIFLEEEKNSLVKSKTSINTRFLVPFCVRIKSPKSSHLGLMGELSPGCELNSFIGGKTITRWLFSASFGLFYTL